jgi:hypothetical protein
MFSDKIYAGTKELTADWANKMNESLKTYKKIRKQLSTNIINIGKIIVSARKFVEIDDEFTDEEKKNFITRLADMIVRFQNGEIPNTLCKI